MRCTVLIIYTLGIHIFDGQNGYADADEEKTRVGVSNYRSKSDPLEDGPQDIIRRNAENYVQTIRKAVSENANLVVFPEGGLTTLAPFLEKDFLKYSLYIADCEYCCPCDDDKWISKGKTGEAVLKLSCAAKSNRVHLVINILEKDVSNDIYNTNLVFNDTGHILIRYRKNIFDTTQNIAKADRANEFKISNREYRTIIGNDIYNECYKFDKDVNIVWSTASKKFGICMESLPPLILTQVYGKENRNIFISDYGDDQCTSSCVYYDGDLYLSYEQAPDHLLLAPKSEKMQPRKKLKATSFTRRISDINGKPLTDLRANLSMESIHVNSCSIKYEMQIIGSYCAFSIENVTTTEHEELMVSICGLAAGVCTNRHNSSYDDVSETKFNTLIINWNNNSCYEKFLPITANTEYWPLNNAEYNYFQGPPGNISLIKGTKFAIFALMRLRNNTEYCSNIEPEDLPGPSSVLHILIILLTLLGIVIAIGIVIVCLIQKKKLCVRTAAPKDDPVEEIAMNSPPRKSE